MPPGERHQVWYPELVARLRADWRPDLSWDAMVALRDQLQEDLERFRAQRGTHMQFDRTVSGRRVVNAGSVGMPFQSPPGAYWLLSGLSCNCDARTTTSRGRLRRSGRPPIRRRRPWPCAMS